MGNFIFRAVCFCSKAYAEPCQISEKELFANMVTDVKLFLSFSYFFWKPLINMLINKFYEVLNVSFIMFDLRMEGLMPTLFLALFTCQLSGKSNFVGTMLSKHSSK